MKILGSDGQHYIDVGPGHTTEVGRLLNLATESWFTTQHGRCLTLAGYHHYNCIKWVLKNHGYSEDQVNKLPQLLNKLLSASHGGVKDTFNTCIDVLVAHGLSRCNINNQVSNGYPSDWQAPALYARLSMLVSPTESFYSNTLPIVWLDCNGNDMSDVRKGIGRYIEVILKLRNDHGKHIRLGLL